MNKTKIDWCDYTWNPLTGCRHGCEYCYARQYATRFGTEIDEKPQAEHGCYVCESKIKGNPYPHIFEPTFHPYRLGEPSMQKEPKTIFVCSMADLFGDWVPERWIMSVFNACENAPQHRYLFLTKNPRRYCDLANRKKLPKHDNFWYGTTITRKEDTYFNGSIRYNTYLSIEPLLEPLDAGLGSFGGVEWIIVGAETGNRKDRVIPEKAWVDNIRETAASTGAKLFMKETLRELMGNDFVQEFPWKVG